MAITILTQSGLLGYKFKNIVQGTWIYDEITFQPAEAAALDTFLSSKSPTTNYGTSDTFHVGESNADEDVWRGLIKFTQLSDATIPINATVLEAILTLQVKSDYSSNTRTLRAYLLKRDWVEAQATWNIYSTGNNWATAGGFGAADCEQTDIGSVSVAADLVTGSLVNISLFPSALTPIVRGIRANQGFLLKRDTESNDAYVYYSSTESTESRRPKLYVKYKYPG